MESNRNDKLFQTLANQYVERYGMALRDEMEQLESGKVRYTMTPATDQKIRNAGKSKRNRYINIIVALAACITILLVVPRVVRWGASDGSDSSGPVEPPSTSDSDGLTATELLPLNVDLPDNFSIEDAKLDRGKTIYYLADKMQDDVVVTMEETDGEDWYKSLREIDLDGGTGYAESSENYQMLVFEQGGILYTLTCEHDLNTLVDLGKAFF